MEDNKVREEAIKKFNEKIKEIDDSENVKELIKDNKIPFAIKEKNYRIRKPIFREKQQLRIFKAKKSSEFMATSGLKLREELVVEHKKNGIDIEAMDDEITNLEKSKNIVRIKLIKVNDNDKPKLKEQIEDLSAKQIQVSLKKQSLLENSIEDLLIEYVNAYLIYLVLEEQKEDKWTRVFNSFEELEDSDNDDLLLTAGSYLGALIYSA